MPTGTVTSANELPLVLTMRHVQDIMGCSKDVAVSAASHERLSRSAPRQIYSDST